MCARPDVQVAEAVGSSGEGSADTVICFGGLKIYPWNGETLGNDFFSLCNVRVIFENSRKYPYREGGGGPRARCLIVGK